MGNTLRILEKQGLGGPGKLEQYHSLISNYPAKINHPVHSQLGLEIWI